MAVDDYDALGGEVGGFERVGSCVGVGAVVVDDSVSEDGVYRVACGRLSGSAGCVGFVADYGEAGAAAGDCGGAWVAFVVG